MTVLHITYPAGDTAEARFNCTLDALIDMYEREWPDNSCGTWLLPDECLDTEEL